MSPKSSTKDEHCTEILKMSSVDWTRNEKDGNINTYTILFHIRRLIPDVNVFDTKILRENHLNTSQTQLNEENVQSF